ncbi:MAG: hypothetical protein ACKO2L_18835 [Planctomycetaceae bacterium]
MSGAFLMAEVPYGGNGFTLLLSEVSRQRKSLAEAAQNAVPRSGTGADDTNILVCRDVSQEDTGRLGSARLVLANVDLTQLDADRQERLLWKLGMLLDNLDALLPDVPRLTGRDCGPVVSVRLKEWEEELKVAQLPAAQELREVTQVATPVEPHGSGKYVALVIGALCLLGYWIAGGAGKPQDVAADSGNTAATASAEPDAPQSPQQNAPQQLRELSFNNDPQPDTQTKKRRKNLSELLKEWQAKPMPVEAAIKNLDAAWSARSDAEKNSVDKQQIADWLASLWWPQPTAGADGDMEAEWKAAASRLIQLSKVANLQSFSGATGVASKISTVRTRFHQDLFLALKSARESRLINHSAKIFRYGTRQDIVLTKMISLDVAVPARSTGTADSQSASAGWQKVATPEDLPVAFTVLQDFGNGKPEALFRSIDQFQLLLQVLDQVLIAKLQLTVETIAPERFGDTQIESKEQSFDVLELLHCETLKVEVGGRYYTLGSVNSAQVSKKNAHLISSRQDWRQLLTESGSNQPTPFRKKLTSFQKENRDPVDEIILELKRGSGDNNDWFQNRDKFRKDLDKFDESLLKAKGELFPVTSPKN